MSHKKITTGYVIQNFETVGGKHICTSQEFIAGDPVDYEDMDGEPIDIDDLDGVEVYQSFDMKNPPPQVGDDGLKFICPKCQETRLECVMDGIHECEVLNIDEDGDFDFGDVGGGDECDRFQCLNCGFVLTNKKENFGVNNVIDHKEVVEWINKNCRQD